WAPEDYSVPSLRIVSWSRLGQEQTVPGNELAFLVVFPVRMRLVRWAVPGGGLFGLLKACVLGPGQRLSHQMTTAPELLVAGWMTCPTLRWCRHAEAPCRCSHLLRPPCCFRDGWCSACLGAGGDPSIGQCRQSDQPASAERPKRAGAGGRRL